MPNSSEIEIEPAGGQDDGRSGRQLGVEGEEQPAKPETIPISDRDSDHAR